MASVINKPFFKFNFEPDDGSPLTAPPDIGIIINILTRHLEFRHLAPKHKASLHLEEGFFSKFMSILHFWHVELYYIHSMSMSTVV